MQIVFSLDFRDFRAAQTLHAKRSEFHYLAHFAARYIYPVLGVCILLFEFTPHRFSGSSTPKVFGIACGLLLIGLALYVRWVTKRSYVLTRGNCGDCTIELEPEIIRTKCLHSRSEIEWTAIQSSTEDNLMFLLYLAPARFLAIPKRVCTEQQINGLRTLLQDRVKSNCVHVLRRTGDDRFLLPSDRVVRKRRSRTPK